MSDHQRFGGGKNRSWYENKRGKWNGNSSLKANNGDAFREAADADQQQNSTEVSFSSLSLENERHRMKKARTGELANHKSGVDRKDVGSNFRNINGESRANNQQHYQQYLDTRSNPNQGRMSNHFMSNHQHKNKGKYHNSNSKNSKKYPDNGINSLIEEGLRLQREKATKTEHGLGNAAQSLLLDCKKMSNEGAAKEKERKIESRTGWFATIPLPLELVNKSHISKCPSIFALNYLILK